MLLKHYQGNKTDEPSCCTGEGQEEGRAAHIEDGEVEEDEDELQADAEQVLQLAHDGARVLQRVGQVATVVVDLQHRLLHVLCARQQGLVPAVCKMQAAYAMSLWGLSNRSGGCISSIIAECMGSHTDDQWHTACSLVAKTCSKHCLRLRLGLVRILSMGLPAERY